MDLQYKIVYKQGALNVAADALSRCPQESIHALSNCSPSWLDNLLQGYEDHEEDRQLLAELAVASPSSNGVGVLTWWSGTN